MIQWLFFDLGSTLIDETDCEKNRFSDLLTQSKLTREALIEKYREYISKNQSPYKAIIKEFHLEKKEWPVHLEKLYPDVPFILKELKKKYQLGIIANQSLGTEERLIQYGIRSFFDVIISSAEIGFAKPSFKIFEMALSSAGCLPQQACMIGDRLDNDIEPASQLNMHTIWVKQGIFADANVDSLEHKPEIVVSSISEILNYL
ncbi:MAG: HAD family hydrolase [Anaeroplasmataceae bacterium]|nr:HAD family hydrolase [Anaeroplasmataceae bacterium]MDE6414751.1 HAD family hydrolase [Anaeroplasmataceae bacterium]